MDKTNHWTKRPNTFCDNPSLNSGTDCLYLCFLTNINFLSQNIPDSNFSHFRVKVKFYHVIFFIVGANRSFPAARQLQHLCGPGLAARQLRRPGGSGSGVSSSDVTGSKGSDFHTFCSGGSDDSASDGSGSDGSASYSYGSDDSDSDVSARTVLAPTAPMTLALTALVPAALALTAPAPTAPFPIVPDVLSVC
jgi:hypothetical protein